MKTTSLQVSVWIVWSIYVRIWTLLVPSSLQGRVLSLKVYGKWFLREKVKIYVSSSWIMPWITAWMYMSQLAMFCSFKKMFIVGLLNDLITCLWELSSLLEAVNWQTSFRVEESPQWWRWSKLRIFHEKLMNSSYENQFLRWEVDELNK